MNCGGLFGLEKINIVVFSYYLLWLPYRFIWHILKFFNKNPKVIFYCGDLLDYVVFEPVQKYLPRIPIVAKNRSVQKELADYGVNSSVYPSFPECVIMCRHALHKFPEPNIQKIGMRHGAYHFKKFTKASRYNAFDIYMVTSQKEVELAQKMGIHSTKAMGFPKLDPAFDGTYNQNALNHYRKKANIDDTKSTVIFTATWNKSGMSAIEKWVDKIGALSDKYNVLASVHPWTSAEFKETLRTTTGVYFIEEPHVLPYLMIADVFVGDTSSIIAEFCALDKPIITFRVPETRRSLEEIRKMLQEISIQIDKFEEVPQALEYSLNHPDEKSELRQKYNQIMFYNLDGNAGKRAAEAIAELVPSLEIREETDE
jgi:CDP-glycerol glycerophosphotransferase (TagB/SpsB family)